MKIYLLLISLMFSSNVVSSRKCDDEIVAVMKSLNINHRFDGCGLLSAIESAAGRCVVVGGTAGLLEDEDDIDRLEAVFSGNTVQNVHHYKNGTTVKFPKFQVEDLDGMDLYTKEQERHRHYILPNKSDGVAGMYMCEDTGEFGNPRGNIVIFSENYNADAVEYMKKLLASANILITKSYPDTFQEFV